MIGQHGCSEGCGRLRSVATGYIGGMLLVLTCSGNYYWQCHALAVEEVAWMDVCRAWVVKHTEAMSSLH